MDTIPLVGDQIEDGRKLLDQLVRDDFDVTVAFWIRFQFETPGPWFYIVSKTVDNAGLHAAYLAIHHSISRIHATSFPWKSISEMVELKLVGMNDFYAKTVLAFRDRHPGRNKFRRPDMANQEVEELYIYPPVTKPVESPEHGGSLSINIGTGAVPEFIDFGKVPLVTILCDAAGSSKVAIVGGGKPQRTLEGEEAQRFIAHFDALRKQME